MKKSLICLLALILTITGTISVAALSSSIEKNSAISSAKLADDLIAKVNVMSANEKIDVVIWFTDVENETFTKYAATNNEVVELEKIITMSEEEFLAEKAKVTSGQEEIGTVSADDEVFMLTEEQQVQVDAFAEKKRSERSAEIATKKQAVQKHNSEVLKTLPKDIDITFQSQYVPMIYASVTKARIKELVENDKIDSIYILENEPLQSHASTALETMGSTYIKDTWGYEGIRGSIGQIEISFPNNGLSILVDNPADPTPSTTDASHANLVLRCLKAAAPQAGVFSTTATLGSYIPSAVEALMRAGNVDIINMSIGVDNYGVYSQNARYIDYLCTLYPISFVTTSGNNIDPGADTSTDDFVSDYGLAYNALTVGGFNYNETLSQSDDSFTNYAYSYKEVVGQKNVPEIMAPGYKISYGASTSWGSSFAAPLVAGSFAQLGDIYYPASYKPELVKALAAASAYYKISGDTTWGNNHVEYNSAWSDRQGAGKFNTKFAAQILRAGRFEWHTNVGGSFSRTIQVNVTSSDLVLRVALAWMQPVESQTGSSAGDLINFDLVLRNPNGIEVARSNSTKNNVELIDYDVTSYGIYTIEIVPVNTYGKTTDLAIAWY